MIAWWRTLSPDAIGFETAHPFRSTIQLAIPLLFFTGLLLGLSVTSVALTYTGDHPVNILVLLAAILVLPNLFLAFTCLTAAIPRMRRDYVTLLQTLLRRWLPATSEAARLDLAGHRLRYGRLSYWFALFAIQFLSIGFFCAALATLLVTITFSDVAFGWSSTLQLNPAHIHVITEALSLPWLWLEDARPTLELVTGSQFFKAEAIDDPELLGAWWPFVAMSVLVWGLLPRLLFLAWVRRQLHTHTSVCLLDHPEVTALLDRLAQHSATPSASAAPAMDLPLAPTASPTNGTAISWNQAADLPLQASLGDTDTARAELLASLPPGPSHITVVTKGWEPPLLAFNDFLESLRGHLGEDTRIIIKPMPLPDSKLSEDERYAWRAVVGKLRDAKIYIGSET